MSVAVSREASISESAPNVPSVQNFLRRAFHSSVAVGDFVYVDSGEVLQLPTDNNGEPIGKLLNVTLSIDMRTSWTNDTVVFRSIAKNAAPNLNKQILWPSIDNRTFFAFGGEQSFFEDVAPDPPDVSCWQFTTDGVGGGLWTIFEPADDSIFHGLTRPDSASGATLDNTGFIMNGLASSRTSPQTLYYRGRVPVPGIVSFNITNNLWQNDTSPQYIKDLSVPEGVIAGVSAFGTDGLLMITPTSGLTSNVYNPPPFNNITIYDPSDKTWHAQTTTGQAPAARSLPCTVGVKGDNGTYEIFLYGGSNVVGLNANLSLTQYAENIALDEVYVLSLPAFAWFKADYPPRHPRVRHTCQVVGNRQMLSIGGHDPTNVYNNTWIADPFSQGLGIFDLTAMQWSDRYNADAEPYETPAVVKAWYAANEPSTRTWNSPAVRKLFLQDQDTPGSGQPSTSSPAPAKSGSSSTGAIVGGVIGGLAALCLLIGLVWWLRRRKGRASDGIAQNPTPEQQVHPDHFQSELSAKEKPYRHEMENDYRPSEMDGAHSAAEMAGAYSAAELYGGSPGAELDSQGQGPIQARR
ncbi:MAG: hypothetical protein Q9226_004283 [Calogaya cf. arnoldii]